MGRSRRRRRGDGGGARDRNAGRRRHRSAGLHHHPTPRVVNPYSPAYHHAYRHGVIPTFSAAEDEQLGQRTRPRAGPSAANDLNYGGGIDGIGVTTGHEKVYLVFYGSQWGTQGTDANGNVTLSGDPSGEAPYLQAVLEGPGHRRRAVVRGA